MRVGGVILCGGRSSRMGTPKAWLPVAGEPLLVRVVRTLAEVVSPMVVVAAVGQELPPVDAIIVRDELPDRGPLHGLLAGLQRLEGEAEAAYVTACDAPLLRPAFVRRVVDFLGDADVSVPSSAGRVPQPLAAAYRVGRTVRAVRELLAAGRSAVRDLFPLLRVHAIEPGAFRTVDPDLDSLRTANTPAEFAQLLERLSDGRDNRS